MLRVRACMHSCLYVFLVQPFRMENSVCVRAFCAYACACVCLQDWRSGRIVWLCTSARGKPLKHNSSMQSSKDAELVESTNDQPNTDCNLNSGAGADEGLFCGAATLQFVSFG